MEYMRVFCLVVVCIGNFLRETSAELRPCNSEDYHFEYTQCDEFGRRWRVAVPNHGVCTPTASSYSGDTMVPVNGTNCKTECGSGQFLSLESQQCKKCHAGTYSSGSTSKFDDWNELPQGFSITTEAFQSYGDDNKPINCSANQWTPKGSYISVQPGLCAGNLILSVSLVKAGSISFEYQFPGSGSLFHVTVQNDQCQASDDKDASAWPEVTEGGRWVSKKLQLKSGFNVINWRVIGMRSAGDNRQPIMLRHIEMTGMAYSSNCASCPAGTFSSDGASECTSCPVNMYSAKGADFCSPCDSKTQYSMGGATECLTRPPCKDSDYYHYFLPCNQDGKTKSVYEWVQPVICNSELPASVHLPDSSDYISCHQCNPGMAPVNGSCEFCPREHRSNGSQCVKCEGSTAPDYGLWYHNWNEVPEGVKTACVSFTDNDCNNGTQWLPYGDHLSSHFARGESAYLVVQVKVSGFRTAQKVGDGSSLTVGQVTILFETICTTFCQLVFLSDESGTQDIVYSWETAMPKTKYVHDVRKNGSFTYTLAFQNSGWFYDAEAVLDNTAKIYSIEVTNTISGGAQTCQKCPKGSDQDGCIPCPDGHYIDNSTVSCVKCPPGTVVYSHKSYGANSCKACGPGLQVYQGRVCMSDGLFISDQGRSFDLRNLTGSQYLKGSLLFASSGMQYYHGFNISLFGKPESSQVTCSNNVTQSADTAMHEPKSIEAKICRSTLVPVVGSSGEVMATQATSLGDHLTAIKHNDTQEGSIIRNLYNSSGFDSTDIENDIQVYFSAEA